MTEIRTWFGTPGPSRPTKKRDPVGAPGPSRPTERKQSHAGAAGGYYPPLPQRLSALPLIPSAFPVIQSALLVIQSAFPVILSAFPVILSAAKDPFPPSLYTARPARRLSRRPFHVSRLFSW